MCLLHTFLSLHDPASPLLTLSWQCCLPHFAEREQMKSKKDLTSQPPNLPHWELPSLLASRTLGNLFCDLTDFSFTCPLSWIAKHVTQKQTSKLIWAKTHIRILEYHRPGSQFTLVTESHKLWKCFGLQRSLTASKVDFFKAVLRETPQRTLVWKTVSIGFLLRIMLHPIQRFVIAAQRE